MITIGVMGGVAGGKSLVTRMLGELGAGVLDADQAGHEVLSEDVKIARQISDLWGEELLDAAGRVDRSRLAEIVFADGAAAAQQRRTLEAILHPAIRERLEHQAARLQREERRRVLVLDAPLLLEAGWDSMCDLLLFVDTPLARRLEFGTSRGWSAEEVQRRQQTQGDLHEKRRRADVVLANNGAKDELREQVARFWSAHIEPRL